MTWGGLATPFVVPPVNLAILAALALLAGRRRLAGLALAGLLLLAVPLVADAMTAALERGQEAGDPAGAQAIVVLGGEVVHQADGRTVPGLLSLQRLRVAAALARRTGLPLLVSGGVTQQGAAPVATAMADSLRSDFMVPARWVEDGSADTFANARASAALLAPLGVTKVLVVTDQWHMRRAMLAFRAAGLPAVAAPVPVQFRGVPRSADEGTLLIESLVPTVNSWMRSYYAFHEWIGIAWYEWRARHEGQAHEGQAHEGQAHEGQAHEGQAGRAG